MKIIKYLIWGLVGGFLYGFTSFYLLSPVLRKNFLAILFYGYRGLIFGLAFSLLKCLAYRIINKKSLKLISNVIIGAISGLLSGIQDILITYNNTLVNAIGVVTDDFRRNVISEMLHFSAGCALMGLIVGFLIGVCELKKERRRSTLGQSELTPV